jgi:NADPH-dependent curcumin reductase CurA
MTYQTTRVVLAERPVGEPTDASFRVETTVLPEPSDGQVLLRTVYLSLDPYMRGRMSAAKSYAPPVPVGDTMVGGTVSQVVQSCCPELKVGMYVLSAAGWQSHSIAEGSSVTVLNPADAPLSTALGVRGMPGFTAYSGLLKIGQPQPGETVVVAAASGPVGSAVGQIAKIRGARAVGIAGGPRKCAYLLDELGFDSAVDHRAPDYAEKLRQAVPNGVDVYFENVGGQVTAEVLPLMNRYGRIAVCGVVAHYNDTTRPAGADRLPGFFRQLLVKSLTVRGFIQAEFADEMYADFQRDMTEWLAQGRITYREDFVPGLENAPRAFAGLLRGANFGKLIVSVADE